LQLARPTQAEFVVCDYTIDTFNEDVKGNLGFEEYQLRRLRGIGTGSVGLDYL
jgi:hypothetical protein